MRTNLIRTISSPRTIVACFVPLLSLSNTTLADQSEALSYHADGACFCTNHVASSQLANKILPTPIGGQSVAQICERVGNGPGLLVENGIYNHPAYSDLQCGNPVGNSPSADAIADNNCTGLSAPGISECHGSGPEWNLTTAYAKPLPVKHETIVAVDNNHTNDTVTSASITSPAAQQQITSQQANKSEIVEASTANREAIENQAIQIIESAYQTGFKNDLAELETIESEPIPAAAHKEIIEPINSVEPTSAAILTAENPGDISPNNIPRELTQDQIREFPEILTEEIPKPVTLSDGTLTVVTDTATLNEKGTTVIVIEADGTPRVMSQEEVERLPLAKLEDVETSQTIESAAADIEPQAEPEPAAALTPEAAIPRTTASFFGPGTLDYGYVSLAPTGYDFGGNGAELEGSLSNNAGLTLVASASVVEEYTEASIGVGFYFSPFSSRSTDFVVDAGVEFGQFDLGITDLDDSGGYARAYLRSRPFRQFELTGGGRFSSFFDGDTVFVATGTLLLTRNLNAFSKIEIGENDQFSLGIRLFY